MIHVKASAPGKCIFFGEHSVVYGRTAVACSVALRTTVEVQGSERGSADTDGGDMAVDMRLTDFGCCLRLLLSELLSVFVSAVAFGCYFRLLLSAVASGCLIPVVPSGR